MKIQATTLIMALAALLAVVVPSPAVETVKPGVPFRDNMVLQSGMPAPVWGTAKPGEKVTVEFAGHAKGAEAGPDGAWRVVLDPLKVSAEPQDLKISGSEPIKGVLVGEVWVCAGQSNMQWKFGKPHGVDNNEAEMAAANHPLIRCLRYPGNQPWWVCSPQTIEGFSAVPYFFARRLTQELGIPVGIISIADGGTSIEAWSPRDALEKIPYGRKALEYADSQAYQDYLKGGEEREKIMRAWREKNDPNLPKPTIEYPYEVRAFGMAMPNNRPTNRYENLVKPFLGYAIRGVLWYQGENNAEGSGERIDAYASMLSNMAAAWRAAWGQGDFPFFCVQLPNFGRVTRTGHEPKSIWAAIREQIAKAGATTPNMQYVVTIDTATAPADLHPRQKLPVGERLAKMALREVYEKKDVVAKGPMFRSMKREGAGLYLEFDHCDGGLKWKDVKAGPFVIAGADRKFVSAKAEIVNGGVLVSSPEVIEPVAVRYAWSNNPELALFNGADLPAGPFRTDGWQLFPEKELTR